MDESIKTVMIVDDEEFIRQSFVDYFEDCLWRTIPVESGEQALEILNHEKPQGIIVDVRLPGMNGNEFIRQAYNKIKDTIFIIYTGSPEFIIPKDLLTLPNVSDTLFKKGERDLTDIKNELVKLIQKNIYKNYS